MRRSNQGRTSWKRTGEVIGICFWGPLRWHALTVPRARRQRRALPRASVPGHWAGVSGAPETEVKGKLMEPGRRGRTPAPRMVPPGGTDQLERPLRGERDPLQGIRQRVPHRWTMHGRRREAEVGQDLRDDFGLLDEGDDPHGPRAPGENQRIDFVHLLDPSRLGTLCN
jgi:hypothetical protein